MIYAEMTIDLLLRQHRKFSPMAQFSVEDMRLASLRKDSKVNGALGGRRSGAARRRADSTRNRKILKMLDDGITQRAVAAKVGLHERTVRKIKRARAYFSRPRQ